jgi:subtilisin family serine protease
MIYKRLLLATIILVIISIGVQTYANTSNLFQNTLLKNDDQKKNGQEEETKSSPEKKYLVGFKKENDVADFKKDKKWSHKKPKNFKHLKTVSINLSEQEVEELRNDEKISYIEEDFHLEGFEAQSKSNQTIPWGVKEVGTLESISKGATGQEIKVAVLDTGIFPHEDLRVESGVSMVSTTESFIDDQGHGTHVAGTIAAINNDLGVLGVAPDVKLYSVKVLDVNGSGTYSQVIEGIEWCMDQGINVISMSLGGTMHSQSLQEIIQVANERGILLIAAAGNFGKGENTIAYPAKYPEVLSVGAIDAIHERAVFSSTGNELDLVAPGVNIISTTMNGQYGFMSGTSMAAPHVTGVAAALWSANPNWTHKEVKNKLLESAVKLGEEHDYGKGLVSLSKAIGVENTDDFKPFPTIDNDMKYQKFDVVFDYHLKALKILKEEAVQQEKYEIAKDIDETINGINIERNLIYKDYPSYTEEYKEQPLDSFAQEFFKANQSFFDKILLILEGKLKDYSSLLEIESTSLITKVNALNSSSKLSLNEPINVDLSPSVSQVYTFTPAFTANYVIYTGPYAGVGPANDTVLELYSDSSLTTRLQINDDSNYTLFSEIKSSLTAGKTYYIKLRHYNTSESVHASLGVRQSDNANLKKLTLNSPVDIDISWYPEPGYDVDPIDYYEFTAPENGTYSFQTSYYGGSSSYGPNDTVLSAYADDQFSNQIAYNDNFNGTAFSKLKLNISTGTKVYIKITGAYGNGDIYARLTATKEVISVQPITLNTPTVSVVGNNQFQVFSFTPSKTGTFRMFTSLANGISTPQDTYLYLYEDSTLTKLLAKNDDGVQTIYSEINYQLTAGKTYYLLVRGYNGQAITTNVSVTASHYYFYDMNGKLDYILLNDGKKLDYQYDDNGNLVKKILVP